MIEVIIPLYKGRDTIRYALDSLVAQTHRFFIVDIVNDHDGIDYTDIIENYRNRGLHIKYFEIPENGGPGNARQYGLDNLDPKTDYVCFLDADDMYMPRALELLYKEAKRGNYDLVSSSTEVEEKCGPGFLLDVKTAPVTWCGGKIYRVQFLKNNNIRFRPELRLNEDSYFNLVVANATDNKAKIDYHTYFWRNNTESLTRKTTGINFFCRSAEQYIFSQIWGLEKIYQIRPNSMPQGSLSFTLINIYTHYMKMKYYHINTFEIDSALLGLGKSKMIQDWKEDINNWLTIINNVRSGEYEKSDDALIFYKMNFGKWFKTYIEGI